MNRITEAWFEFDGVRCAAKGLRLMSMPRRTLPAERGEEIPVPGRSGTLWIGENGAREGLAIEAECVTTDGFEPEAVMRWLSGKEALLRFSDEPTRAYRARVKTNFVRENLFLRFDRQKITIPFDCQPYRYVYPAEAETVLTAAGTVRNSGSAASAPRITVTATGDYTLIVGATAIDVTGGSIIIDSEKMDCFDLDGVTPANNRAVVDEFPLLEPGANGVSWDGSVTNVRILPRSRSL